MSTQRIHESTAEHDAGFWQARAEQLQHALETRIVIEQAKGVLAERFGCDAETAFEILRRAARTNRRKLHDLAREVVASAPKRRERSNGAGTARKLVAERDG